ncbi:hypothetical protein DAPPUDRAFT_54015 [Daphnia pulex]|uniref:Uncharacterized protein n=1 Tax=Daphnia pulex TaxID=6669 RepID=E9GS43_DAPPU|nr:hypothetical protein DAPPUDRAFT_54015 [Daphnia pulex]|eukprot:EFX77644.1 hypothetical protein DAPPUDRAFT_54015 [Daphnia pulex]
MFSLFNYVCQQRWTFLARFCFLSMEGRFTYDVEYDLDYAVQKLLLYYDTPKQWPLAYDQTRSCEERESLLLIENNQIINLTSASRTFRSSRERWWFIAVSNCPSSKGLSLKYRFWMTNGPSDDIWFQHFSADEFYILHMLIGFLLAQLTLSIVCIMCGRELKARQLLHSTYKMFITSVLLQAVGLFLLTVAYGKYANDGVGSIGRMFEATSEIFYILMLILLGKGYTVTRARLRSRSVVKVTVFMSLYCVTYIALFTYERQYFDPGKVLYVYESPAGYGLLVLRFLGWMTFVYGLAFTLKHYPEKNGFYLPFFFFSSLWFVSGPVIIILSNHLVDKWVRETSMVGVEHSFALLGFLAFLVLTRPNAANSNFPYHVRTSQIGVMEQRISGQSEDSLSPNHLDLDRFPHHPYEPTLRYSNPNGSIYAISNGAVH